MNIEKSF